LPALNARRVAATPWSAYRSAGRVPPGARSRSRPSGAALARAPARGARNPGRPHPLNRRTSQYWLREATRSHQLDAGRTAKTSVIASAGPGVPPEPPPSVRCGSRVDAAAELEVSLGLRVGDSLGLALGDSVGLALGDSLGLALGDSLGLALGDSLGLAL